MKFTIDLIGWLGCLAVLAAYFLNSSGRLHARSSIYQGLNFGGAVFLIFNTYYYGAFPSMFVNVVWCFIAIYAVTRDKNKSESELA